MRNLLALLLLVTVYGATNDTNMTDRKYTLGGTRIKLDETTTDNMTSGVRWLVPPRQPRRNVAALRRRLATQGACLAERFKN